MSLKQLLEGPRGIVFVNDNQAFTDSRIIAEVFQKGMTRFYVIYAV
ncbi:hypothetical protein EYB33_00745 (plasmid) [Lysinibacillus sphaericus]|nr:hypothetical protein [Lysinibacillus sphaericus]UDK94808.1 hypothetical protein EYB33_00140 [Lysinibacillus sphaericus]UDK94901.1 hypothetical protein EYB33_00745 [Lysinibacillus sphaericus]